MKKVKIEILEIEKKMTDFEDMVQIFLDFSSSILIFRSLFNQWTIYDSEVDLRLAVALLQDLVHDTLLEKIQETVVELQAEKDEKMK